MTTDTAVGGHACFGKNLHIMSQNSLQNFLTDYQMGRGRCILFLAVFTQVGMEQA